MPDARPKKQIVAAAMFVSAIVLFACSMLFFTRTIDVGDLRIIAGTAVAMAAAADLFIAIWFFRQGQAS
jgi:hypothetical protein